MVAEGSKGKVHFNIVDALIVMVVLVLLGGGYYKFAVVNHRLQAPDQTIEYRILIQEVRRPSVDAFQVGQVVREAKSNISMGTIVDKEVLPHKEAVPTADGRLVMAVEPDYYDLYITLRSPAVVTSNSITIGNKIIQIGTPYAIANNMITANGIIYGIKLPGDSKASGAVSGSSAAANSGSSWNRWSPRGKKGA